MHATLKKLQLRRTLPPAFLVLLSAVRLAAQEPPPNMGGPFDNLEVPSTISDEIRQQEAAAAAAAAPAAPTGGRWMRWAAAVTAVRLGRELVVVTAVGWAPEGDIEADITLASPPAGPTLGVWVRSLEKHPGMADTPAVKFFRLDLDLPEWSRLRGQDALRVRGPGGDERVVPIEEFPLPARR